MVPQNDGTFNDEDASSLSEEETVEEELEIFLMEFCEKVKKFKFTKPEDRVESTLFLKNSGKLMIFARKFNKEHYEIVMNTNFNETKVDYEQSYAFHCQNDIPEFELYEKIKNEIYGVSHLYLEILPLLRKMENSTQFTLETGSEKEIQCKIDKETDKNGSYYFSVTIKNKYGMNRTKRIDIKEKELIREATIVSNFLRRFVSENQKIKPHSILFSHIKEKEYEKPSPNEVTIEHIKEYRDLKKIDQTHLPEEEKKSFPKFNEANVFPYFYENIFNDEYGNEYPIEMKVSLYEGRIVFFKEKKAIHLHDSFILKIKEDKIEDFLRLILYNFDTIYKKRKEFGEKEVSEMLSKSIIDFLENPKGSRKLPG